MIINKMLNSVSGTVEFAMSYNRYGDSEEIVEHEEFSSFNELMSSLSQVRLEEVKNEFDADSICVTNISFSGRSEDGETSTLLSLSDKKVSGWISTKINNDDIDNRLLTNIQHIKRVIDNTLDQYPIKY